jgi:hypothetical protein
VIPAGLWIAPCSREEAKGAIHNWHYSKSTPKSTSYYFGVWEDGEFAGAVLFSAGANRYMAKQYGVVGQALELVRVALKPGHKNHVSRVVAIVIRLLRKELPELRLLVSYADPDEGHTGGIYRAMGWDYHGQQKYQSYFEINGKVVHKRSVLNRVGSSVLSEVRKVFPDARFVRKPGKHKFVLALDEAARELVKPFSVPYPKSNH